MELLKYSFIHNPCNTKFQIEAEILLMFTVLDTSGIGPLHAGWCADQVVPQLHTLLEGQIIISSTDYNCPNITNTDTLRNIHQEYVCPTGHIYKNPFCCEYTWVFMQKKNTMCNKTRCCLDPRDTLVIARTVRTPCTRMALIFLGIFSMLTILWR